MSPQTISTDHKLWLNGLNRVLEDLGSDGLSYDKLVDIMDRLEDINEAEDLPTHLPLSAMRSLISLRNNRSQEN